MKILFVTPPAFNDVGRCKSDSPPLALMYLAAYLEKHGYTDVKVIDTDQLRITWAGLKDLFIRENPDILGISSTSYTLPALVKTAQIARQCLPNCLIITGGYGSTTEPEKVLRAANRAVNFVVVGEGEVTLLELVKRIEGSGQDFSDIAGLAFLNQEGNLTMTKPRGYLMDLDSVPWPAFHLLSPDFSKYPGAPMPKDMLKPRATIIAARGCPHRCLFCSMGSKMYRQRSPKDVVDEMEFYKNKFGVKSIQIYDDEFVGMSPQQNEWIQEICGEMIRRNLRLPWLVQGRCSQFVDLATLKKMKEAGCIWIWWGVESGSQKVLDIIHKDIKIENVYRTFDLAKQAGIQSLMFMMVGFPGETPEDIKMSTELIRNIKPDLARVHVTTPFPGSQLRKYLQDNDLLEQKLENLEDYYTLDTDRHTHFHTKELTAAEIEKYYKFVVFTFGACDFWYFVKFGIRSLGTIDGWRKLSKRMKIAREYFLNWLKFGF